MSEYPDHPYGLPITVMKLSDTGEVIVENEEIEDIFNREEIQDRKIVILSLIGAFRGGKSYFLNYCLRFLYGHYSSINNPKVVEDDFMFKKDQNWMGSGDEPLNGFSWRSGVKRDTIGIIIWSDVFLHTIDKTGEKLAIVVMDTQGLFDKHSSITDNSRIFVLSNLISSIQVLNLSNRIQEDQLQYLQFTTEFAKLSLENKKEVENKPFQNLMFLIRDWNNGDDFKYGIGGGRLYLEEVMKVKSHQKSELQSVRESISSCFEQITCCLLPHPGKSVAGSKNYDGNWSKMDEEFKDELQSLIECLLLPENLIKKKINSMDVNVKEMKQYILDYLKLFQTNEVPKVSTLYELTVEGFMDKLVDKCLDDYVLTIHRNEDIINEENIVGVHDKCKERALEMYDAEKKMGNSGHAITFKAKLENEIESYFVQYKDQKEQNLEKIKAAREKCKKTLKKVSERKEELLTNISRIMFQLVELDKKRAESRFLSEFYDTQEEVLRTRLASDENDLQIIEEKLRREERFKWLLMTAIAGVSLPISTISVAGVLAAGATEVSAVSAIGIAVDAFNIYSSAAHIIRGAKMYLFGGNKKEQKK